ncbi:hypothetical protein BJX70DRAFT_43557 [Aspergillus crustosus]
MTNLWPDRHSTNHPWLCASILLLLGFLTVSLSVWSGPSPNCLVLGFLPSPCDCLLPFRHSLFLYTILALPLVFSHRSTLFDLRVRLSDPVDSGFVLPGARHDRGLPVRSDRFAIDKDTLRHLRRYMDFGAHET